MSVPLLLARSSADELDLDGKWSWRNIGKGLAIAGGVLGALACGASVVCGIAVGAAAGAAGVAVISGILGASSPADATREFLEAIDKCR